MRRSRRGHLPRLAAGRPEEAKGKIGPKVLVLHGHADAWVAPEVIANFRAKLEEAGANWEMNSYGGAKHGFTNPDAGKYGIPNLEYNKQADERSWTRMQEFWGGVLSSGIGVVSISNSLILCPGP